MRLIETATQADILAALQSSPLKPGTPTHLHVVAPHQPALHPLVYAHQLGLAGIDTRRALLQRGYHSAHYAPSATNIPTDPYAGLTANSTLVAQHAIAAAAYHQALYQAQLAQTTPQETQQQSYNTQHAQAPILPAERRRNPFVYVQLPSPEALKTVRGKSIFHGQPVNRQRTAQACERCRKRKSKCSGSRPKCQRCDKRDLECVYVLEHRANRTKSGQFAMSTPEEADPSAEILPLCPPAGPSDSSSSGYSSPSGYLSSAGSSPGYSVADLPSRYSGAGATCVSCPASAPTAIKVDRCPVHLTNAHGMAVSPSFHPQYTGLALSNTAILHPTIETQVHPSGQPGYLHPQSYNIPVPRSRSMPGLPVATNPPPRLPMHVQQMQLRGCDLPPALTRDVSMSSSCSGISPPAGAQGPADYFRPTSAGHLPASSGGSYLKQSSQMGKLDSTTSGCTVAYPPSCVPSVADGLAETPNALNFSELFHSFSSDLAASVHG